jgi:hypothetical protein
MFFSGIDLVHGTPVLDIKPYHPNERLSSEQLRFPKWILETPMAPLRVTFADAALRQLKQICESNRGHPMQMEQTSSASEYNMNVASSSKGAVVFDNIRDDVHDSELERITCLTPANVLFEFYDGYDDIKEAIMETLRLDPRPICTKKRHDHGIYGFVLDKLNVIYRMTSEFVAEVVFIEYREVGQTGREVMRKKEWLEEMTALLRQQDAMILTSDQE